MYSCLSNSFWPFRAIFPGSPLWNSSSHWLSCNCPDSNYPICPSSSQFTHFSTPAPLASEARWFFAVGGGWAAPQLWQATVCSGVERGIKCPSPTLTPTPLENHCIRLGSRGEDAVLFVPVPRSKERPSRDRLDEVNRRREWQGTVAVLTADRF